MKQMARECLLEQANQQLTAFRRGLLHVSQYNNYYLSYYTPFHNLFCLRIKEAIYSFSLKSNLWGETKTPLYTLAASPKQYKSSLLSTCKETNIKLSPI